ncbi:MAG: Lrp/AsnC family transcriptional regulator [Actinomycetales bacterium]
MPADEVLDDLDRRIVCALQIDGRAPWRKIAAVIGEPERSVARRGGDLLARGVVSVVGIRPRPSTAVLRLRCQPGMSTTAAEALAQRPDTTFSYVMTGGADVVGELASDSDRFAHALGTELPATTGLVQLVSLPVLHYFRTVRGWSAGALTQAEAAAMHTDLTGDREADLDFGPVAPQDTTLIGVLIEDGRASLEAIARRVGVSETTAARRLEFVLRQHRVEIRAIVEPAVLGLPVEAMLWLTTSPGMVNRVGQCLAARPQVRYAAATAGPHQLVADVTVPDMASLYAFICDEAWAGDIHSVEASLLLAARKRGGLILRRG